MIYSNNKISIIILFTIASLTGFTSIIYNTAYSISVVNTNDLPGIADNPVFDLLKKDHMIDRGDINGIHIPGHEALSGTNVDLGHLTVIVNTIDSFNLLKQVKSSDFMVHVISDGNNQQSLNSFTGSESGTKVKVAAGNYQVTEDIPSKSNNAVNGDVNVHFSQDCSGIIHNNEVKTCKITNTIQ